MKKKHNMLKLVGVILILIFSIFCYSVNAGKTLFVSDTNQDNYAFIGSNGIINDLPSAPIINGPSNGQVGVEYDWTFVSTDPEGENITYYVDWGDECGGGKYHGPYPSDQEITLSYTYQSENTFFISALAIDTSGGSSPTTYFEVTMPRYKSLTNPFIIRLLEQFPNAFALLRYIFGLSI